MEKKYQVFISSTYQDLIEERREVIQAILELDCIPVGMELFPATDDDQWTLIKNLIDDCDYYLLVIGARYGTLSKEGISYTQKEYEYALEQGIPIISFIHRNPDEISVSRTDKNEEKRKLLENFKNLVSQKMIKHWESADELGSVVSRSLVKIIKMKPRNGWVRADKISSDEANMEILKLRERILELESENKKQLVSNIENLAQGSDIFEINFKYRKTEYGPWFSEKVKISWEKLFSKSCTLLIDEASESNLIKQINALIKQLFEKNDKKALSINVSTDTFRTILIQFKALGLIQKSSKKRSLKDNSTYWTLTVKGDALLTQLRAIKKPSLQ